jgi:hypothetical protein
MSLFILYRCLEPNSLQYIVLDLPVSSATTPFFVSKTTTFQFERQHNQAHTSLFLYGFINLEY